MSTTVVFIARRPGNHIEVARTSLDSIPRKDDYVEVPGYIQGTVHEVTWLNLLGASTEVHLLIKES